MAAWLVTEDPQQLIRLDTIVSINPIPVFPEGVDWQERQPWKRWDVAHHIEITVGTMSGQQVCAVSCPAYYAWATATQLLCIRDEYAPKYAHSPDPVFVWGQRGKNARWAGQVWTIGPQMPEPDWPPSLY
ncbi:hypothetical protein ACQEVF_32265 [Nonomuraea polychroma]|uniref:hypothetical protein n=1 Tax=Nonomuraea polychroma TaxID=46176 RepID=UPI003D89F747